MSLSSEKQSDGAGTSIIKKSMFEGEAQYLNNWPISKKSVKEQTFAQVLISVLLSDQSLLFFLMGSLQSVCLY